MQIALISSDRCPIPAVRGGSIQILIDGIKDILARENDLTVYSISDPSLPEQEALQGICYNRYPKEQYWAAVTADLIQRTKEFDLIHIFNRPKYLPQIKEASPQSRIVLSLHNKMMRAGLMTKQDGLKIINSSDRILVISSYLATALNNRFQTAAPKVRTWYSGVDVAHLPPVWSPEGKTVRKEIRLKHRLKGKKVILFAGRLLRKKGVHLLIQAFLLLARERNDLFLIILGGSTTAEVSKGNDYQQSLHELSYPVKERVIFTGFIPPQEIHSYYLAADIFICPSQWQEPLGRVHYEAMAAGIPIITMNRGGIPEVIQDGINGIVVEDYNNPSALAGAIIHLLEHPKMAASISKKGRLIAEEKFSFQRVAGELLGHYREIFAVDRPQ